MSFIKYVFLLTVIISCQQKKEARWDLQNSNNKSSLRGISAVSEQICWISGNQGIVGKTIDGGKTWISDTVQGFAKLDFRDIEAFSKDEAVLMSAGEGNSSRIFYTEDGGKTWQETFKNPYEKGFFCGFAFWDKNNGILMSDPVDKKLRVYKTNDGGKTWSEINSQNFPEVVEGEYGFAASGTNLSVSGDSDVWIATGGSAARVFYSADMGETWEVFNTPIIQGSQSTGIFSITASKNDMVAVGGDYKKENEGYNNLIISRDAGKTWDVKTIPGFEYRSAVSKVNDLYIATGPYASSISYDNANNWKKFSDTGFHALSTAKDESSVWASGRDGKVAKLNF